ncbi:MAG: HAD family hydrolase [Brevinemataceae bacterium]
MKFKGFIFDLDGTLVDSLEDLKNAVNHALSIQGFPEHSLEDIRIRIGHGIDKLIEHSLPENKRNNTQIIAKTLELMAKEYGSTWKKNTCLFPGVAELLNTLMIKNIKIAILSNKPQPFVNDITAALLSKWDFDMVIGSRDKYPLKPDPLSTLAIIKKFNLPEEQTAIIGDGDTDIKTGIAAGITPIAALWGFRTKQELITAGAEIFIENPLELLEYI